MKKEEIQAQLGKAFETVREKRHLSRAKIADKLFISVSTWNRYESGESSPTVPEFIRIFSELNEDALKYVLRIVYPETYGGLDQDSKIGELRQAAAHYFLNVASEQTVRIWDFLVFGDHGSNIEPQVQEFCMYEHLPMQYKLAVASLIDNLYLLAEERGELVGTCHVMPKVDVFRSGLNKGREAAYKMSNSYTTSTE